jgi:sigma-B regulation protein RsbU (phosphoserine phosphatase)
MDSAQIRVRSTTSVFDAMVQEQLVERLEKLRKVSAENGNHSEFGRFIEEVDAAIQRYEDGTYGICEECHEPLNAEELLSDPLMRVCLDELSDRKKRLLEDDLQFASEIQRGLLPKRDFTHGLWKVDFVYEPAGIVSGDYLDIIVHDGELFFILGDVSGKGMAASLLMSHLHAIFHSLIPLDLSPGELMSRANRLLVGSSMANQFVTLVCGKANADGEVETVNAGHLPPLVIKNGVKGELAFAGLPLGMFSDTEFVPQKVKLNRGDSLLLFTDGVTETFNDKGIEFGTGRLCESIHGFATNEPRELIGRCLEHVAGFRGNAERTDDLSMLALSFV